MSTSINNIRVYHNDTKFITYSYNQETQLTRQLGFIHFDVYGMRLEKGE